MDNGLTNEKARAMLLLITIITKAVTIPKSIRMWIKETEEENPLWGLNNYLLNSIFLVSEFLPICKL